MHVELTMTTPACPMGEFITDKARRAALPCCRRTWPSNRAGVGTAVDARQDVGERKANLRLAALNPKYGKCVSPSPPEIVAASAEAGSK